MKKQNRLSFLSKQRLTKKRLYLVIFAFIYLFINASLFAQSKAQGRMYFQNKNYEKAIEVFSKLTEQNPNDAESWFYLGYISEQQDEYDNAIDYYHLAISSGKLPWKIKKIVLWKLIIHHKNRGEFANTYKYAKIYLEHSPKDYGVNKEMNELKGKKLWTYSAEAEIFYAKGLKSESQGDNQQALAMFEKALSEDPSFVQARFKAGSLYMQMGKYSQAKSAMRSVLNKAPFHGAAHYQLAVLYEQENNCSQALVSLNNAEKYIENEKIFINYRIPYYRGRCFFKQNDLIQAKDHLHKALEYNPRDTTILLLLGIIAHKQENFKLAKEYYNRTLTYENNSEAFYRLFLVAFSEQDLKKQRYYANKLYQSLKKNNTNENFNEINLGQTPERYNTLIIIYFFDNLQENSDTPPFALMEEMLITKLPWKDPVLANFPQANQDHFFYIAGMQYWLRADYVLAERYLLKSSLAKADYLLAKLLLTKGRQESSLSRLELAFKKDNKLIEMAKKDNDFQILQKNRRFLYLSGQMSEQEYFSPDIDNILQQEIKKKEQHIDEKTNSKLTPPESRPQNSQDKIEQNEKIEQNADNNKVSPTHPDSLSDTDDITEEENSPPKPTPSIQEKPQKMHTNDN